MKTRITSALIMLPLLIFVFIGGWPLMLMCIALSTIAMFEFYRGYENQGIYASKGFSLTMLCLLYLIIIWGEFLRLDSKVYAHLILLWIFLTACGGVVTAVFKEDNNILDGPVSSLGIFYIAFFMSHIVLVDRLQRFNSLIWLIFLSAFGTDTFAYFTGYFLGKHKLCPALSPKKTVEGAIGGMLGSTVLCGVFGLIVYPDLIFHCTVMGFVGSIFAQLGDLSASAFKRKMGIKDYGNLIPGHGGIMDRFDSVLLTAPFIYYYTIVFVKP